MLKYAYALYRESCVGVNHKESYSQFAEDFINFKRYVNCNNEAVCMNIHNVNYHRLIRMFLHNESLVRKYFDRDSFTDEDCDSLLNEFLLSGGKADVNDVHITTERNDAHIKFDCYLTDEQIAMIADAVNKAEVFTEQVTDIQMRRFFDCELQHPLTAKKIRSVVTVFHALMVEGVIKSNWQKVISDNGLILSPKTGKPLSSSNLSSALSEIRQEDRRGNNIIRQMARDVARIKIRDTKEGVDGQRT